MTESTPDLYPRKPYRIRSAETWDLVRTHYLRGESARSLSERYGVSVSNIRRRAGDEGWTRKGHAELTDRTTPPPLAPLPVADDARPDWTGPSAAGEPEPLDLLYQPEEVAALALGAVARCLQGGRYADAERLGRLAESMTRLGRGAAAVPDDHGKNAWDEVDEKPKRTEEELKAYLAERLDIIARRVLTREFPGRKIVIGRPDDPATSG